MTTPGAEDDVVERLRDFYFLTGQQWGDEPKVIADGIAIITRLREELKEAREAVAIAVMRSGMHADERDTIRQQTIEECATVADARVLWLEEKFGTEATAERVELEMIAKAIRSIDGGGKP